MEHITVIGSGLMGHGIAQIFAVHGYPVWVVDPHKESLETVHQRIRSNLDLMSAHGIQFEGGVEAVLDRVNLTTSMETGCAEADFVIEAVFEDLALKQDIFNRLDQRCRVDTILCSNTSVMSITDIASRAAHRERIVGTHFWNPPYLIPLVEVVKAQDTSDEVMDATFALLQKAGKRPVKVWKDVPGFVGNRLQHALWREAFAMIDEGICDPATVDEVVRTGPGLRWPVLGPVVNADLVGLDLTKAIHDYILPHINADPTPSRTLLEHVEAGELGFKTGRGFLAWTKEEIENQREQLLTYLLEVEAKRP